MITYKEGNLFDAKVDALVNAVNTVGVMGKGIALQFKFAFPESYQAYKKAISLNQIVTGKVQIVPVNDANGVKYVINFPTKAHWRNPSKIKWVEEGLNDLKIQIQKFDINSVAIPPLGCGNGGLSWEIVKPLIQRTLADLNIDVVVYEPSEAIKKSLQ